jgi:hypothetical protein
MVSRAPLPVFETQEDLKTYLIKTSSHCASVAATLPQATGAIPACHMHDYISTGETFKWRRHVSPKRQMIFNGLHGVLSKNIEFLMHYFC